MRFENAHRQGDRRPRFHLDRHWRRVGFGRDRLRSAAGCGRRDLTPERALFLRQFAAATGHAPVSLSAAALGISLDPKEVREDGKVLVDVKVLERLVGLVGDLLVSRQQYLSDGG